MTAVRTSFWLIVATLLGSLCVTTSLTPDVDYRAPLIALGGLGAVAAVHAAFNDRYWATVLALVAVVLWSIFRPLALNPGWRPGWGSVAIIWSAIAALVWWGRVATIRMAHLEVRNAQLRRQLNDRDRDGCPPGAAR